MSEQAQDWFAANAQQGSGDWFAANAPKAEAPKFGETPSAADMLSGSYLGAHEGPPTAIERLNTVLQDVAHPQSVSDVAQYFIPSATPQIIGRVLGPVQRGVAKYGGAALDLGASLLPAKGRAALNVLRELSPSEWHSPLTVAGREGRVTAASRAFNDQPLAAQMAQLPETPAVLRGRVVEPPPRNLGHETPPPTSAAPTPTAAAASPGISPTDRTLLQKQGYPPDLIARIEQRLGQSGVQPMASHVPAPSAMPPPRGLSTGEEAGVQSLDQLLEAIHGGEPRTIGNGLYQEPPMASHPLREPRINVGAEAIGRQQGMSKDAVRQATGPVLDEGIGEASPILPKAALSRIVDDMRALSPGAEREAYVARATSGKAKWQVENIRRTLEHLGLLVPFAASVREQVMQRLMPSHASGTP